MNGNRLFVSIMLSVILFSCAVNVYARGEGTFRRVFSSPGMSGFAVNPECNPDGKTPCWDNCTSDDVAMSDNGTFGTVTSNKNVERIWVNAIGGMSFEDNFLDERPIVLGTYKYKYDVKLPIMPNMTQPDNIIPECVHQVMVLWDGDDALFQSDGKSVEAGLFWSVNPWHEIGDEDLYGRIKIYTSFDPIVPIETELQLAPDTEWHTFELVADFVDRKYVSITIDGDFADISDVDLPRVDRSASWGRNLAFIFSAESLSIYPTVACPGAYTWTTYFRNFELSILDTSTEISTSTTTASATTTITSDQSNNATSTIAAGTNTTTSTGITTTVDDNGMSTTTTSLEINTFTTTTPADSDSTTTIAENKTTSTTAGESTTTTIVNRKRFCLAERVYGEDSDEVDSLRVFRDRFLSMNSAGREFIRQYYKLFSTPE